MERSSAGRHDWRIALAITVVQRVFYSAVAALAALFLHPHGGLIRSNALTEMLPSPGGWHYGLIGVWERFDTLWYLRIAERGYDLPGAVVFYPLYPALIRALSWGVEPAVAALMISTIAAFFYFLGLLRLSRGESAGVPAERVVLLAAVWPASFYFFAGYTEALALALIVWCMVWARDERWLGAAACAIAAGLTRSAGTLLIVPLIVMSLRTGRGKKRWSVLLAPSGTIGYWLWLRQSGRLGIAAAYGSYWKTSVAPPWTTLWLAIRSLGQRIEPLVVLSLIALIFSFAAGVVARRRAEDRWFSAAVIGHMLLRVCTPPLFGAPRYLLPVYAAYLTTGEWTARLSRGRFALLCAALFACNLGWMWAFLSWSLVL
jgi:hypothetical protein